MPSDKDIAEFDRAATFYRTGKYVHALEILRDLAEHHPNDKQVLHALALARDKVGQRDEARKLAKRLEEEFKDVRASELLKQADAECKSTQVVLRESKRRPVAKPKATHGFLVSFVVATVIGGVVAAIGWSLFGDGPMPAGLAGGCCYFVYKAMRSSGA